MWRGEVGQVNAAISLPACRGWQAKKSAAAAANNLCLLNLFKFNQTRSILWKVSGSKDEEGGKGKGRLLSGKLRAHSLRGGTT